jgi:hypothetical protein
VDLEGRARPAQVLHRRVELAALGIVEDEMALRERAALGVLAGETDGDALDEEAGERERLGLAPVDESIGRLEGRSASLELPCELGMHGEPVRSREQLAVEGLEDVGRNRRGDVSLRVAATIALPWRGNLAALDLRTEARVRASELRLDLGADPLHVLLGHYPVGDESSDELRQHGRVLRDQLRQQRLRVGRLVLLVVAEPPVSDQIDHGVVAEPLSKRHREPNRRDRRLGVVGVDVDDRNVEPLREVARVARRAPLLGVGREPDLVVRDHVQRPARRVAREALEVQCLGHDALGRERRVAVDEDRHRDPRVMIAVALAPIRLFRAGPPLDDGIDELEMAGVRRK